MKIKSPRLMASTLGLFLLTGAAAHGALSLNFVIIPGQPSAGSAQITGLVESYVGGVSITITNSSVINPPEITTTQPTVTLIAFDDAAVPLLGSSASSFFGSGAGVIYTLDNPTKTLQGHPNVPGGDFETSFSYSPAPPPSTNGLDPGESITFNFDGADLTAIENAITGKTLRIGVHLQQLEVEGSTALYAVPGDPGQGIPEPATTALGLIGTLLLLRRRRN